MTDWEIHGMEFTNCSCNYGCPCQFNALPTYGYCRAVIFVRIDKGYFGDARLDGLNMAWLLHGLEPFMRVTAICSRSSTSGETKLSGLPC
jgi:hypothetical protein